MHLNRNLAPIITQKLNQGKVIVLYGPRRAGKTTLVKNIFPKGAFLYLQCEEERIQMQLDPDSQKLLTLIGDFKNIILDEAQYLENPGLILKILIDNFPHLNIIATGSSSFDLSNKLSEPLTGRHYKFSMYPVLQSEIRATFPSTDLQYIFEQTMIYGSYPEVLTINNSEEKISYLLTLTDAYLYKDILAFNLVKNSKKVRELLIALALQIGSEVSYSELASTLGIDKKSVENYIDLLEKSFVLFRLYGFSRNLRSEINRKVKIYFYDLGVRNAIINNFNPLNLRADQGAMLENYVISEMIKSDANKPQRTNFYFWRTYQKQEIDLIAEINGQLTAYEIKIKSTTRNKSFLEFEKTYPGSKFHLIAKDDNEWMKIGGADSP